MREHVHLEVDVVSRRELEQRRLGERVRDQRHLEPGLVERGDGERDAVDRDRALLDAVAQQLGRALDPDAAPVALRLDRGDAADAVDVALHLVAAERIAGTERRLDVDAPGEGLVRASVSGTTSKASLPSPLSTTVRQTPAIATESPSSALGSALDDEPCRPRTTPPPPPRARAR